MKLTSLAVLSLLAALSFAPSSLASSDPYVVSGVDYNNPWDSDFYFDSTKGSTLANAVSTSVEPFIKAWKANATKTNNVMDLTFLGKWAERIDKSSSWFQKPTNGDNQTLTASNIDAHAVRQLVESASTDTSSRASLGMTADGSMCWAHAAANMLQYWQCYYGIFATNKSAMQHGYAVEDASTAKTMLGVQSLNTTKWFYDNFTNNGGDVSKALGLYLGKDANYSDKTLNVFENYFSSASAVTIVKSAGTIGELTTHVLSLMGVDKADNGSLSSNTYGQLIGLDIAVADRAGSGHSLTMYGFGLDETGQINRLIYADSNVASADGLRTVYVKENNGALVLYEDAACHQLLGGEAWQISKLTAINTPDSLKDMRRQYAEGDLVWKGGNTWTAGQGTGSMATAMPTDATGWQVSVNGAYYNSYFDASRNVRFNDDGNPGGEIRISGTATAHNMTIDAVSKDYTFNAKTSGAADSIVLADDLIKSGAAKASFALNISAAGLSVKGGTLAVGSGCTLTISGTSMIERGATLSVGGGGTASLGNATFAAGSVLSVSGTKNTLNASYLTFADGARLSFDLSNPETKNNVMLKLEGVAPGFNGKVYFDFNGGDLNEKYRLIYFGSSVNSNCLDNFVSYKGTFKLESNYLTLTYAEEVSATWTGNTNTWSSSSSSQWSSTPEGASVTFDVAHAGTVTVSGTVNPAAINVTGGIYVFESDSITPGSISGSRDLTISGGASLESQMSLGEHAVVVQKDSSFTYNIASDDSVGVSDLRLTDSTSKATFKGNATYDVWQSSLSGSISVKDKANLVLHSDADVASVTLAEQLGADAQLSFRNSSNSGMVQYTLSTASESGTINVGSEKDTFGTRLNVSSAATAYTVAKDSVLSISGSGTSNFKASGDGTVLVDSGQTVVLEVSQSAVDDGSLLSGTLSDVNFEVAKTATASLTSESKNLRFEKTITVNGTLAYSHTYKDTSSTVEINRLKLDSGTYKFNGGGQSSKIVNQVDNLEVIGSGTIYTNYTSSHYTPSYYPKFEMRICKLSGDGNINFLREKTDNNSIFGYKGIVQIDKLDDFAGSIMLTAGLADTFDSVDSIQNLVFGGGSMTGAIEVAFQKGGNGSKWSTKTNLAFSGDTTIGGLKSTALSNNANYSANYDKMLLAGGTCSIDDPSKITTPSDGTRYTLTIKTQSSSDDYTYTGHVGEGLNLAKQGEGKQSFVGDLGKFNGDVEVKGGTLVMTSSAADGVSLDDTNTTMLNATSLSISGGAILESNLTVKVSGAFEARAYVSDLVGAAEAATFDLDDAVGTNATENPVATINAALDLSNAKSLTFETGVDLKDKALTLWTDETKKALTLSRSMGVSQEDGTYDVTLFKNVGSVEGLSSGSVDAATLFTSDNLTSSSNLVYDSTAKTIVLTNVTFDTPEPTTATLALLGLMGLCARRRRKKSASSN